MHTGTCEHFEIRTYIGMLLGKSFWIQDLLKTQSGEESSSSSPDFIEMKNSLHQTAFLNAPEFERIFPTSVGNFAVRNLYSIDT